MLLSGELQTLQFTRPEIEPVTHSMMLQTSGQMDAASNRQPAVITGFIHCFPHYHFCVFYN